MSVWQTGDHMIPFWILLFSGITWWDSFKLLRAKLINPFSRLHNIPWYGCIRMYSGILCGWTFTVSCSVCVCVCVCWPVWTLLCYINFLCISASISWTRFSGVGLLGLSVWIFKCRCLSRGAYSQWGKQTMRRTNNISGSLTSNRYQSEVKVKVA